MKRVFNLRVNGELFETETHSHRTLLDVLRNELNLTGTKKGCDQGECGKVLWSGRAVIGRRDKGTEGQSRKIFKKISLSHLCSSASFFVALCLCAFASLCLRFLFPALLPFIKGDASGEGCIEGFDPSLHGNGEGFQATKI